MVMQLPAKCIQCSLKQATPVLTKQCFLAMSTTTDSTVRITVPHSSVERYRKSVVRSLLKKRKSERKFQGPAIISCKKQQLNHYRGQTYTNFNPEYLASRGWKKGKSKGDYFTINAFSGNPALRIDEAAFVPNFSKFGIHEEIVEALRKYNIEKPTNVQAQAIPHLLKGKNMLCCSETGSGKTLAYMIPIIERLIKHNEEFGGNTGPNRPYGLILVPSRELADQIAAVAHDLGVNVGFYSFSQCGGRRTQKLLRDRTRIKMDILIATPGVLSKVLTNRIYDLSRLSTLVLDEVDTLFDDSFNSLTLRIVAKIIKSCGTLATRSVRNIDYENIETQFLKEAEEEEPEVTGLQIVMTGATIPKGIKDIAGDVIPIDDMVQLKTKQLHKLMPHVSQKFCRVASLDRFELLLKHLKQNQAKNIPTMVFCNRSVVVQFLWKALLESNIETAVLHAQMSSRSREHLFEQFQRGKCNTMICTDLGSRGLDTVMVEHVINFDFPLFMSDYIHRVGRVGRVGSVKPGFVLNFVCKKWDVELVWKIETAARRVTELSNVNANIKRKITKIVEAKFGPAPQIQIEP